jgi:hypothetical protein
MSATPGDHRPAIRLSVREQLAFMRLVDRETHPAGRRLLDTWARPEDATRQVGSVLDETFKLMWRSSPHST